MVKSSANSVADYLAELSVERRAAMAEVRGVILGHLPPGYEETMLYGMISYVIPLETYPTTYNGQPLMYAALASQKSHMSLYLMNIYGDPEAERWFVERYRASGKKLDMGKSCVRFKKLEDLPLDLVGEAVGRTSVAQYIGLYQGARSKK